MSLLLEPLRRSRGVGALSSGNAVAVLERGLLAQFRVNVWVVVTGWIEPVLYLLAFGYGLGGLVGTIDDGRGHAIPYAAYIAPALMAVSAMNGAVMESTFNVLEKMHYKRLYEGMLATRLGPLDVALGEISLALLRGAVYAIGFQLVMQVAGLNLSWWALLAVPATVIVAFGFGSFGMGITSYAKSYQELDWVNFALVPMFLLSATFFPIAFYPDWLQWIVMCLPLWQAVELIRGLTTGVVDGWMWLHLAYFVAMIVVGLIFTTRRLRALFLS